jgi:cysteinyl-tRNA synthetase
MLKVTNTLTGKKEQFTPLIPGKVLMYVCGVTPYAPAHIGHGRCYVSFDVVYRFLKFLGYDVRYCRNFTDIDDKLINKAEKEFGDRQRYKELADKYIRSFHDDMRALDCQSPNFEPCVTDNIPEIIEFIQGLIDQGQAYQSGGDVYFSVRSFDHYGELSNRHLDDLRAGARVDVREDKKDPLDFALWKSEPKGTFWKSPWGYGRPGWHIECSALAEKYLGDQIDIHGGGLDLIFPHHENERAQSEALHKKTFVRYWLHNGLLNLEKEKMSKSIGNVLTLDALFKEYDPMVLRFYFMSHHYRSPMDFSLDDMPGIQKSYNRLCYAFQSVPVENITFADAEQIPVLARMCDLMAEDFNTAAALGVVFEHLNEIKNDPKTAVAVKSFLHNVLGLSLVPVEQKGAEITPEIQKLLDAREQARRDKNWKRADELRDQLKELGHDVQDKKI